jgi:hypothetical protein
MLFFIRFHSEGRRAAFRSFLGAFAWMVVRGRMDPGVRFLRARIISEVECSETRASVARTAII